MVVAKLGEHAVYVKHWKEKSKGLRKATGEVNHFEESGQRIDLEENHGLRFKGGFAIEVYWSYKEPSGVIYMEYVKYR